jgi:hypothetical protein
MAAKRFRFLDCGSEIRGDFHSILARFRAARARSADDRCVAPGEQLRVARQRGVSRGCCAYPSLGFFEHSAQ